MITVSVVVTIASTIVLMGLYGTRIVNFYAFGWANIVGLLIGSLIWDQIVGVERSAATVLILASLVAYLAGGIGARLVVQRRGKVAPGSGAHIITVPAGTVTRFSLWLCLAISLVALGFHFYGAGVPILAEDVNYAKVESFAGTGFIFIRFLRIMLPLLLLQYIVLLFTKGHRSWSPSLAVLVFIAAVLSYATGFKGYFIYFFLIPLSLIYAGLGKLSSKTLAVVILLLPLQLLYIAFVERTDIVGGLVFGISRLTLGNAEGVYYLMNSVVSDHGGYFLGKTFLWDMASFLSRLGLYHYEGENLAAYIFTLLKGDNPLHQQAVTSVIGEFYANFGPIVMLLFVMGYGMALDWYTRLFLAAKPDPIVYPSMVLIGVHLAGLFGTGPILYNTLDFIASLLLMGTIYLLVYAILSLPTGRVRLVRKPIRGEIQSAQSSSCGRWSGERAEKPCL